MPDLPTLTVTQPQADRIQAAFGGIVAYRDWLRRAIKDEVTMRERRTLRDKYEADMAASDQQVQTDLGGI